MTVLLEARSLVKSFGSITAVNGISFTVTRGEVLGFLGPNGAGKSTTMKMLAGYLRPTSGEAFIAGFNVEDAAIAAKQQLGYLPEGAPAYDEMTPAGFLAFVAAARGLKGDAARAAIDKAVSRTHLQAVLHQPIESLSKGFKRRVGLAQAIIHDPAVLILDEPTDGLDPNQKQEVRKLIQAMAADKAIIISTHILEEVEAICTRALVIDKGQVVADGTPAQLRARSRYHNAVTVTLKWDGKDGGDLAPLVDALRALPDVAEVATAAGDERTRVVTVLPARGQVILDKVTAVLRDKGHDILEIAVDPGRLEDVFWALTSAEAGTRDDVRDEQRVEGMVA